MKWVKWPVGRRSTSLSDMTKHTFELKGTTDWMTSISTAELCLAETYVFVRRTWSTVDQNVELDIPNFGSGQGPAGCSRENRSDKHFGDHNDVWLQFDSVRRCQGDHDNHRTSVIASRHLITESIDAAERYTIPPLVDLGIAPHGTHHLLSHPTQSSPFDAMSVSSGTTLISPGATTVSSRSSHAQGPQPQQQPTRRPSNQSTHANHAPHTTHHTKRRASHHANHTHGHGHAHAHAGPSRRPSEGEQGKRAFVSGLAMQTLDAAAAKHRRKGSGEVS